MFLFKCFLCNTWFRHQFCFIDRLKTFLLPTICPPSHIVCAIPNSSLSIVYLPVDEHTHPLNPRYLRGNNDGSPNANVFMGKEERAIIFVFLHLIYSGNASMTTFFFTSISEHWWHYKYNQCNHQIRIHLLQTNYFLLRCSGLPFWIQKS